jgi:endonuclease/exonuclease/phosphatase family metal-dependent hydrolase
MSFDIAGIQEVSYYDYNQLKDININDRYEIFFAPTQLNNSKVNDTIDPHFQIDGNAIFVEKNIIAKSEKVSHKILHISAIRCAQMVSFDYPVKMNIINCHLHHQEEEEAIRVYEIKHILKWVAFNTNEEDFTVILGDFNTLPNSSSYEVLINQKFKSLYSLCYRKEPIKTFHSSMEAPHKDKGTEGTYDYKLYNIFI